MSDASIARDVANSQFQDTRSFPFDKDRLVVHHPIHLTVSWANFENHGLRIYFEAPWLGFGFYNDTPYSDVETTERKYAHLIEQMEKGNYSFMLGGASYPNLEITKPADSGRD